MIRMPEVSIPSPLRPEMRAGPNSSDPTAPTILILMEDWAEREEVDLGFWRERRAHATAWLAPLPPEPVENEDAVNVSPPEGTRGVTVTRL